MIKQGRLSGGYLVIESMYGANVIKYSGDSFEMQVFYFLDHSIPNRIPSSYLIRRFT